ncbi:MAG: chemotaxis protein [Sulfurospirillum sp.]|nr:MAG: chemotaxis protein [Sulfurospirillum sp.]
MTQEELDALMAGDIGDELEALDETGSDTESENTAEDHQDGDDGIITIDKNNFKVDAQQKWPPPPPTDDHKVVNQLDDVTRDSEKKATEIMDKLEEINNHLMDIEADGNDISAVLEKNIETFEKLSGKFPNIPVFADALEENKKALERVHATISKSQMGADDIMMIMDIMQYQDIHRQKIERVINVMRALSKYMNSLFESTVDDASRVSSAVHIEGDEDTADVVSEDDIEALLASFGQK